jgi:hypothetical protein
MDGIWVAVWVVFTTTAGLAQLAFSLLARRKLAAATRAVNHRVARITDDILLANWARTTTVTVMDRTGVLTASTLDHFYNDHGGQDCTWLDPIAVTIWGKTPGTHDGQVTIKGEDA